MDTRAKEEKGTKVKVESWKKGNFVMYLCRGRIAGRMISQSTGYTLCNGQSDESQETCRVTIDESVNPERKEGVQEEKEIEKEEKKKRKEEERRKKERRKKGKKGNRPDYIGHWVSIQCLPSLRRVSHGNQLVINVYHIIA